VSVKINTAISEIEQAIIKIKEETQTRDSIFTVRPVVLKQYPDLKEVFEEFHYEDRFNNFFIHVRSYWQEGHGIIGSGFIKDKTSLENSLAAIDGLFAPLKPIHETNLELIKENERQRQLIVSFMTSTLGLIDYRYESHKSGRQSYSRRCNAHWVDEVYKCYPISDDQFRKIEEAFKTARQVIESWFSVENKKMAAEAKTKEDTRLMNAAIQYLVEHGKQVGVDFDVKDSVSVANNLAADLEIQKKQEEGGFHDFSGQNCDGPCEGWDGSNNRCQCGNRRVSWVPGYGHTFEEPYIIAEAY